MYNQEEAYEFIANRLDEKISSIVDDVIDTIQNEVLAVLDKVQLETFKTIEARDVPAMAYEIVSLFEHMLPPDDDATYYVRHKLLNLPDKNYIRIANDGVSISLVSECDKSIFTSKDIETLTLIHGIDIGDLIVKKVVDDEN